MYPVELGSNSIHPHPIAVGILHTYCHRPTICWLYRCHGDLCRCLIITCTALERHDGYYDGNGDGDQHGAYAERDIPGTFAHLAVGVTGSDMVCEGFGVQLVIIRAIVAGGCRGAAVKGCRCALKGCAVVRTV